MKYNISQAARIVGVTRKTFYKHIDKKGITVELDQDDNKLVDASELIRVYGDKCNFEGADTTQETPVAQEGATPVSTPVGTAVEIAVLQEKLVSMEEQRDHFEKLYREEKTERQAGMRLLTDQREQQGKWEKAIEQLQQQVAQENRELKDFKKDTSEKLLRYKKALMAERNKTLWQRLFASNG